MERNGLQARGEIREHFGKYFSKPWLKHWGSGFLCILEWRKSPWYWWFPSFCTCHIFPPLKLELWLCKWSWNLALQTGVGHVLRWSFAPSVWMPHVPWSLPGITQPQLWHGDVLGDVSWVALQRGHSSHLQILFQFLFAQCYRVWHLQVQDRADEKWPCTDWKRGKKLESTPKDARPGNNSG